MSSTTSQNGDGNAPPAMDDAHDLFTPSTMGEADEELSPSTTSASESHFTSTAISQSENGYPPSITRQSEDRSVTPSTLSESEDRPMPPSTISQLEDRLRRRLTPSRTRQWEDRFHVPLTTTRWEEHFMNRDYHIPLLTDNHVLYFFTTRTNFQLTRPETIAVKNYVENELHEAGLHKFSLIWLSKAFDAGPHGFLLQFSIFDLLELPQELIVKIGTCVVVNAHTDVDAIRYYPRAVNDAHEVEVAPPGHRKCTFRYIP